jgi:hypothetical protein
MHAMPDRVKRRPVTDSSFLLSCEAATNAFPCLSSRGRRFIWRPLTESIRKTDTLGTAELLNCSLAIFCLPPALFSECSKYLLAKHPSALSVGARAALLVSIKISSGTCRLPGCASSHRERRKKTMCSCQKCQSSLLSRIGAEGCVQSE